MANVKFLPENIMSSNLRNSYSGLMGWMSVCSQEREADGFILCVLISMTFKKTGLRPTPTTN